MKSPAPRTSRPEWPITAGRAEDASTLLESAESIPGVAELLDLYAQHARMVNEARKFTDDRSTVVTITSSDATA